LSTSKTLRDLAKDIIAFDSNSSNECLGKKLEEWKKLSGLALDQLAESNRNNYNNNIEEKRKKRTINNSKIAIKNAWKNRKNKKKLIKKHIDKLRVLYSEIKQKNIQ
jgi:DNA-directed RNA polymerase beta' subunit